MERKRVLICNEIYHKCRYNLVKDKTLIENNFKEIRREINQRRCKIVEYPETIQLPITYKCNFDCVMCGMHHMINRKDFSAHDLKTILSDKLFSKVKYIGINGGEPFLKNDLCECINVMIDTIPDLKILYFISNGYFTEKILIQLQEIKKRLKKRISK